MSCDYIALATPGVQQLSPYQPGKPVDELRRELGLDDVVKLASNENPRGPGERVRQAAAQALESVNRYPDGSGFRLKQALSERLGVNGSSITLGNGSNDVLELVARAWTSPGDEVVVSEHAFAIYYLVALGCSAKPVVVPARNHGHDLAAMADAVTDCTRVIYIANPNNPTGTWSAAEELDSLLERVPDRVLVVLDEAYFEYVEASGYPDGLTRLERHPNLVVTRTFSKIHGLAGLRVGYAVSSPEIADVMNRIRQPFNCNAVALAAAEAALEDDEYVRVSRERNTAGLAQLTEGFRKMGLDWIPSVANFIAVDCAQDAAPVYKALLREGVIVRPLAGSALPRHLRVTTGLPEENERFLRALERVLEQG